MHARQHTSAIAILRHSTLVTALETGPAMHPKTRIVHRAYDTATILHIFAGPTRTSRTCRLAPRSPTPSHHAHARTGILTTRQAPSSTAACQRHGACHPKQRTPTSHARHIAHSRAAYKHTSPARPQDVPHSRNHRAVRNHHCTHTAARTPHTARHSSTHPTRRPQKITPSHTRGLRATPTAELSGCPASTGCCRRVGCCTRSTACSF
jgi:hypothetical protein